MKKTTYGFDENFECNLFESLNKAFKDNCAFCIEYCEDTSEDSIDTRYKFNLVDAHKNAFYITNGWVLKSFKAISYFGRVKILMCLCDPFGYKVELTSPGYSEHNFVLNVNIELLFLIENYKVISYFISNKARNNYLRITQDFHFEKRYGDINEF